MSRTVWETLTFISHSRGRYQEVFSKTFWFSLDVERFRILMQSDNWLDYLR